MSLDLQVNNNPCGWGPNVGDDKTHSTCLANILKYPFEPSLKPDRIGRICDFTFATYQRNLREGGRYGNVTAFEEEMTFQTVDTRHVPKQKGPMWIKRKPQVKQTTAAYQEKSKQEEELMLGKKLKSEQKKQQAALKARFARINARQRTFAEWSVQPTQDWTVEAEIPLSQLPKQTIDASKIEVEDLKWCGELRLFNKQADRITPKGPVTMQALSNSLDYYWVSTQDDDYIKEQLLDESKGIQVAATDQVLACLMAAPQSKYSWHLDITKIEGKLIFDKTDGSIVDLLTVNETAPEPPMQDADNKINRPPSLGYEAVKINQNFRQQVLVRGTDPVEVFEPAPFVEKSDNPASVAYRYRIFKLPGKPNHSVEFEKQTVTLITRAEVNAKIGDQKDQGLVSIFALNEYDTKRQKSWKSQMETQRGALLASEIRNNACKLKKFVASAMIAGCDDLKLGFVSRKQHNDNESHVILAVQSHKTKDFGLQIGLKPEIAWGIVRSITNLVMSKPDGRYVLLKDPMKPVIRLYSRADNEEDVDETLKTA